MADLDQVAIGVADVAADLGTPVHRWREPVCARVGRALVERLDVSDADVLMNALAVSRSVGVASVTTGTAISLTSARRR